MRNTFFPALALVFLGLLAHGAAAGQVAVNYKVDVGPMTLTTIKFVLDIGPDAVNSKARIKSGGIANLFSEYSVVAEATSLIGNGAPQPVSFRLVRERDSGVRKAKLTWADGVLTYEPQSDKPERRESIARALNANVTDPITAVLRIGTAGETPCPSVHDVFDGRDVFELALTGKGSGTVDETVDYRGAVQLCEVRWTPIGGRAKEKNVPGDSYDVAFAPVDRLPTGQQLWLPVDLTGSLKGLPFRAYADTIEVVD
ncbi:DUF3108 domain-containing protein [Aestuariivirga sp.]|uniref:DUF3108 domain-containing protein n=1 Tax=Aestuariivirga sp. TaxID=2650926 RepID=UPI0025C16A6D|nr:DUF3108 domain-containing protein [Aestuariivirga sp.]MCA3555218.1 DUF3108 domain-containing protein [Aestuariivirga sp.]